MRNRFVKCLLLALLAVCLAAALVACNPSAGNDGSGTDSGEEPSAVTYSVTFDANGAIAADMSKYNLTGVAYGSLITKPDITPVKTGYVFNYWETSDGEEFFFATDTVKSDLVLTAHYTAKTYNHDTSTFLTDGNTYADGNITFDGKVTTTYNSDSATIDIPTTDDENDWFVYWYYMDGDKKVQLTEWAEKGATSVSLLSKYTVDKELTLYPMFYSRLPEYTVDFVLREGDANTAKTLMVKQNDTVNLSEVPTDKANEYAAANGYDLVEWYYVLTSTDSDGETVRTEVRFVYFDDIDENADNDSATKVSESVVEELASGTVRIALYGRWVKHIEITSSTDFDELRATIDSALTGDDESEKYAYRNANIYVKEDVTFTGAPLYDEDNPFNGTLDGSEGVTKHVVTINAAAGGDVGFIGANTGVVKNLKTVVYVTRDGTSATGDTARIGGVVVHNAGTVDACECDLTVTFANSGKTVLAGGIAAETARGSAINNCTVNMSVNIDAYAAYVGGIVAKAAPENKLAATAVTTCVVRIANGSVVKVADTAYFGGVVGYADAVNVEENGVTFGSVSAGGVVGYADAVNVEENGMTFGSVSVEGGTVYAGAFAGLAKWGKVNTCYADGGTLAVTADKAYVGGMLGYSETELSSSRIGISAINVTLLKGGTESYIGGIAGISTGTGGSRGNVSVCHALVGKINVVFTDTGARACVGGFAGSAGTVTFDTAFVGVDIAVDKSVAGLVTSFTVARVNGTTVKNGYFTEESSISVNEESVFGDSDVEPSFALTVTDGAEATAAGNYTDYEFTLGDNVLDLDRGVWTLVTVDGKDELHLVIEHVAGDDATSGEEE